MTVLGERCMQSKACTGMKQEFHVHLAWNSPREQMSTCKLLDVSRGNSWKAPWQKPPGEKLG